MLIWFPLAQVQTMGYLQSANLLVSLKRKMLATAPPGKGTSTTRAKWKLLCPEHRWEPAISTPLQLPVDNGEVHDALALPIPPLAELASNSLEPKAAATRTTHATTVHNI